MTRRPFAVTVKCETCGSVEQVAFAAADPEGVAAMVAAATVAEAMLHGHRVDVGWEWREAAPARGFDLAAMNRMRKVA